MCGGERAVHLRQFLCSVTSVFVFHQQGTRLILQKDGNTATFWPENFTSVKLNPHSPIHYVMLKKSKVNLVLSSYDCIRGHTYLYMYFKVQNGCQTDTTFWYHKRPGPLTEQIKVTAKPLGFDLWKAVTKTSSLGGGNNLCGAHPPQTRTATSHDPQQIC